jgi:RNA polymerase-binding transcription factor DksA
VKKVATPPKAEKAVTGKAPRRSRARAKSAEEETKITPAKPLVTVGAGPNLPRVTPMVAVQVSTLEAGDKSRYSDSELDEFRNIINAKLDDARRDYDLLKQTLANTDNNGTEDTSPSFKMIEDGSETLSREETAQLAGRQEKFIKHLEDALLRIRNKTYGICRVTGKLISKERLRLVPHATLSIEAKQQMSN